MEIKERAPDEKNGHHRIVVHRDLHSFRAVQQGKKKWQEVSWPRNHHPTPDTGMHCPPHSTGCWGTIPRAHRPRYGTWQMDSDRRATFRATRRDEHAIPGTRTGTWQNGHPGNRGSENDFRM